MSSSPITWLDGKRAGALPIPDRGLDFGDGLFETLLFHYGQPLYPELHLERLQCGLSALGMGVETGAVKNQLACAGAESELSSWQWASVRVTITRGGGPRGYAPPEQARPRLIIQAYELQQDAGQMRSALPIEIAEFKLSTQPALAGLKHLNRLEQVLAAQEAKARDAEDLLLLAQSGQVASVIAGNIFAVQGSLLQTPAVIECGVAGTRRRLIIEKWGGEIGCKVSVAPLSVADVREADEVFCTNSLVTVRSIKRIGDTEYSSSEVAQALFACFVAHIA